MLIEAPGKKTQPVPEQPLLIPEPEVPATTPIDQEILERLAHENQKELRKQRKEEAEKDPYTNH